MFFLDGALVVDCKAVLNAVSATDHTRYQQWVGTRAETCPSQLAVGSRQAYRQGAAAQKNVVTAQSGVILQQPSLG